jgi:hypothetical protein
MTLEEDDPSADGEVTIVNGIHARHFILATGIPAKKGSQGFIPRSLRRSD